MDLHHILHTRSCLHFRWFPHERWPPRPLKRHQNWDLLWGICSKNILFWGRPWFPGATVGPWLSFPLRLSDAPISRVAQSTMPRWLGRDAPCGEQWWNWVWHAFGENCGEPSDLFLLCRFIDWLRSRASALPRRSPRAYYSILTKKGCKK